MENESGIIGIKVGSNILVKPALEGEVINQEFVRQLCWQIARLRDRGYRVFLVTSGAVASDPVESRSKNLRAGVGNFRLMKAYDEHFRSFGVMTIAPIVVTDYDLHHPAAFVSTINDAFNHGVMPIINANDPVWNEELKNLEKCCDNDHLFTSACRVLRADYALIGIDQPGLLDNDDKIIRRVSAREERIYLTFARGGSLLGRGGMRSKLTHLCFLARNGIKAIMVPASQGDAFLWGVDILSGRSQDEFGTVFVP